MPLASPFTDQLTAWSTLGGAVGSILAVVVAYLLLRKEIHSRNEEKRDAEAAQARTVIANVVVAGTTGSANYVDHLRCTITNHSNAPILAVETWFGLSGQGNPIAAPTYLVIAPGDTKSTVVELANPLPPRDEMTREALSEFSAATTFTDAMGIRWNRVDTSQPTRVFPRRHADVE